MKYVLPIFFMLFICCGQKRIPTDSVESIALIQVDGGYLGIRVDSIKLDDKLIPGFLKDFADRKKETTKFYSCYVIKIRLRNGELISYRTNGHAFEKYKDDTVNSVYFVLNSELNIITRYWGIPSDKFCEEKQTY